MESRIPCGFGFSTENEMRCRYDLDDFNHIIGCRSLAHLQGCGKSDTLWFVDLRCFGQRNQNFGFKQIT